MPTASSRKPNRAPSSPESNPPRGDPIALTRHVSCWEFYLWQVRSFTVRLALDFVDELSRDLARLNPAEEQGGLLLGRIVDNDHVEVTSCEFIRSEHHRGISYDLSGHERYAVDRRVRSLGKNRRGPKPVGYFRTHLRPGLFLDQSDFALMSESFANIPAIALAIRTDRPGPPNAGIFFWEYGDIDRKQPELTFPFDAATLRVQGPIEQEVLTRVRSPRLRVPSASLLWGTAAALSVFAMSAEYRRGEHPSAPVPIAPIEAAVVRRPPIEQLPLESALPQFALIEVDRARTRQPVLKHVTKIQPPHQTDARTSRTDHATGAGATTRTAAARAISHARRARRFNPGPAASPPCIAKKHFHRGCECRTTNAIGAETDCPTRISSLPLWSLQRIHARAPHRVHPPASAARADAQHSRRS
jgi:hypothetical protein